MLHSTVLRQREVMRQARSELGSTLRRLGEHHVRNKEYSEAMGAFVEALHEKKNAYMEHQTPPTADSGREQRNPDPEQRNSESEERASELDEVMLTLSNIGNVHSLLGEHSEAMRCYAEVMALRTHPRSNLSSFDASSVSCSGSSNSGMGSSNLWKEEDNSTVSTELNEDVKALDDLFRSISFRNGDLGSVGVNDNPHWAKQERKNKDSSGSSKKSKRKGSRNNDASERQFNGKRTRPRKEQKDLLRKSSAGLSDKLSISLNSYTTEPQVTVDQLSQAITTFRSVLGTCAGKNKEKREQDYFEFIDQITTLRAKKHVEENDVGCHVETRTLYEEELYLALDIYDCTLSAQRDMALPLASPSASGILDSPDQNEIMQASCNIASTLISMGSLHYKLNNVDEELRLYYEALSVYTNVLGETHPYAAGTRKNIGMVLAERREFDAAMEQFQCACDIYRQGNDNGCCKNVASALSCMGNVQNRRGDLDDALNLYGEALHIYKAIAEEEEEGIGYASAVQEIISMLKIIGMVHAKTRNLNGAMDYFNEAMDLLRSSSRNTGRGVASIMTRIAAINCKRGQYEKAMVHYLEAYDLVANDLGTTMHPAIAVILHHIGGIHHKCSRYDEARDYYIRCVNIYRKTLGAENPAAANPLVCIGSIHFKKKSMDDALEHYTEALRLIKNAHGTYHPEIGPTLKSIGMIHAKTGNYDAAMIAFQEVLLVKSVIMGNNHPDVANAYKSIGNVHFKKGEFGIAERQYRQALSIYRGKGGDNHPDTISTKRSIEHIRKYMGEDGSERQIERKDVKSSTESSNCMSRNSHTRGRAI